MSHRHRRLTAWLGLIAIWFAIAVPLASQWRASERVDAEAIVCSASHAPGTADTHRALQFDQCGYCNLFAHVPAIGGMSGFTACSAAVFAHTLLPLPVVAARVASYPSAYPRAPPGQA